MFESDVMSVMLQDAESMAVEDIFKEFSGFLECHHEDSYPWAEENRSDLNQDAKSFLDTVVRLSNNCLVPVADGLQFHTLGSIEDNFTPDLMVSMNKGKVSITALGGYIVANLQEGDAISVNGLKGIYFVPKSSQVVVKMFDNIQQMMQLWLSMGLADIYGIKGKDLVKYGKEQSVESTDMHSVLLEEMRIFESRPEILNQ
jgi:hypothetical protein